ncbi:TIGR01777 family oxidoreductase [Streptosporangium sp. KLBMP 9127]|nr:TIGR01777 family oxidoreductase [Streptosporangium sp. KLBMP 9127]
MAIIVTGSSGLLGTALVEALREQGRQVVRLVRRAPQGVDESFWNPAEGLIDRGALEGAEAVVHLAGAGIGDHRWTGTRRREILRSRVEGTRTLVTALTELDRKPEALLSASGIHYYGDTGDRIVDESGAKGTGFLTDVVARWEAETEPAAAAGIRVATLRTALVLSRSGGSMARMLPIFRMGLGAPLGSGRQYWSWITIDDWVNAVQHILKSPDISTPITGPVNLTSPEPVTNREFTKCLGKALKRPTMPLAVPGFALTMALGGFAEEGVLTGPRAVPGRLLDTGYVFRHNRLDAAFSAVI